MHVRRRVAPIAASLSLAAMAVPLLALPGSPAVADSTSPAVTSFNRVATYPVFQNLPSDVDPASTAVAEISAVSEDGRTLGYTDAAGRVGFLDISDADSPKGLGTLSLGEGESPTSIAFHGGYLLAVIDASTYPGLEDTEWEDEEPSIGVRAGRLAVIDIETEEEVASIDLGGQPDSIAISKGSGTTYAAIAIENQRNEAVTPAGGDEGDLPQAPAGFVQTLDLTNPDPTTWTATPIALTNEDGTALPALEDAGLDTPEDPEPEYVSINSRNKLLLSLQENNGLVVIDLATKAIDDVFDAGDVALTGIDTKKDALLDFTGSLPAQPREPDSVGWIDDRYFATANEGDWKGGTRGWTVFDSQTGEPAWDAGNTFEHLAATLGLENEDRAAKKGSEPEGLAVAEYDGTTYAFVGSERSNFVAVYDMTDPLHPEYRQALPTTNGPEGLLPIPSRDLFVTSSETDDASVLVRASVGIYELGEGKPVFPTIHSETADAGDLSTAPLGWGALGALSADPGNPNVLWTASDSAFTQGRIYRVDVSETPALITGVRIAHHADGSKPALDIEGLAARRDGGFWLASEGATGAANKLVRTDRNGLIQETVPLPAAVTAHINKWGLEGVTSIGSGAKETVYVAVQRPLWADGATGTGTGPDGANVARIGRYVPATGAWDWFGYPLETTSRAGDWIGLSEITAIDGDTLAVIERDKQNGTTAAIKRLYTVDIPAGAGAAGDAPVKVLRKTLAYDVLPALRAFHGWTQEKLEGMTIGADRQVYAVTDNDGLKDATGETQLLRLGAATTVFKNAFPKPPTTPVKKATSTRLSIAKRKAQRIVLTARVTPGAATGRIVFRDRGRVIGTAPLRHGVATLVKNLKRGKHQLRATYAGSSAYRPSTSNLANVKVKRR
jgi:hypothetical protein